VQKEDLTLEKKTSSGKKLQLKGLTLDDLRDYFESIDEPKYRAEQVFNWMYNHLVEDFNNMHNLPKPLRTKLSEQCQIKTLNYADSETSSETGTKKFIFETEEKHKIESVIIPEETSLALGEPRRKRTTLCISTQVGCPLDCKFCATGLMGYKKNLTSGEIFDNKLCKRLWKGTSPILFMQGW
jgi:23S rRNA (adenine2503-C2)-methyltransferase